MSTIKVRQYRPAYFEGFENEVFLVDSKEEMFNIPFIKQWDSKRLGYDFLGYTEKDYNEGGYILSARIFDHQSQKEQSWVIAFFINEGHPLWDDPRFSITKKD